MRLGAESTISTLRPAIIRDILPESLAASHAGFSIAYGSSTRRSRSPPRFLSSTREPKRITIASLPASSAVMFLIDSRCAVVMRMRYINRLPPYSSKSESARNGFIILSLPMLCSCCISSLNKYRQSRKIAEDIINVSHHE